MLLQVLWALEALATVSTLVWLQWDVNTDVGGNVVALDGGGTAVNPSTGQVQIVGRLASDMALADVLIEGLGGLAALFALVPLTGEVVVARHWLARDLCRRIDRSWCGDWRRGSWEVCRLSCHLLGRHRERVLAERRARAPQVLALVFFGGGCQDSKIDKI